MNATAQELSIKTDSVIYVNAIEMRTILGTETSRICLIDYWSLKVGQFIEIQVRSVARDQQTGLTVYRYITELKPITPLFLNEDYIEVILSPFKPLS